MTISVRALSTLACAALVACGAPGDPAKGKGTVGEDLETKGELVEYGSAAVSAAGSWTSIGEVIQSPHDYANNYDRTWTVRGSDGAERIRLVFDRVELESGYDWLFISDAQGRQATRHTGTKTGEEVVLDGSVARIRLRTDYSVTEWGFALSAFEPAACVCAEIYQPVCGVDGRTYGNVCVAGCSSVNVEHNGECRTDWFGVSKSVASDHPYVNHTNHTWTVREGGASRIRVHLASIDVERGYDFVRILDGDDNLVHEYTGKATDVTSPAVAGDTIKVQLVSDYSVTAWGFEVDRADVIGGCANDSHCGPGNRCVQVTCVRAPCFAVCEPIGSGGGIVDVTVAELDADPRRFSGQRVRVTAEPTATLARCTRRGCTQDNPCCNSCSAGFDIGDRINLSMANGSALGCSGNECNWQQTCQGFTTAANNGPYTLEGTFELSNGGKSLALDDYQAANCAKGGCSGQVCANTAAISTCEWRDEYACYRTATCAAQADGHCAFTQTPELRMCIANAGAARPLTSTDTPLAIPDADRGGVTSTLNARRSGTVGLLHVSVAITHTYRGDLAVTLVAPDGKQAVLHNTTGGSVDDLNLDLDVPSLSGSPAGGEWKLVVQDLARLDTGTLDTWSLSID